LKENNLKGNVIKVYENTYEAINKSGKWEMGGKQYGGSNSTMTFNENGFLSEYVSFDEYDKVKFRIVFYYDENDYLMKSISYNADGNLHSQSRINYDSRYRLSKVDYYDSSNKFDNFEIYDYSIFNKVIGVAYKDKNGKIKSSIKNNWSWGSLVSQIYCDSTGKIGYSNFNKHNRFNDIIESYSIYDTGTKSAIIKYTYEYDDNNNWTKQTVYSSDSDHPNSFTVRRIIYKSKNGNKLNSDELITIWKEVNDNDWIEFKKDGTYDKGYKENITDYGKWELNEAQKTLTLKSNEQGNSKKYSYEYKEQKLSLSSLDGNDRTEYEKR
jgi:hypothetical protein